MQWDINTEYFEWLFDKVCGDRFGRGISYRNLLVRLHNTEFTYIIPKDQNRAKWGIELRRRFVLTCGYEDQYDQVMSKLIGPCSVLEMMVALAIQCEENTMDDPRYGDRTRQWFWNMITSLGLGGMMDGVYDERAVDDIIRRFLRREYSPDGKGGLFTIRNCLIDLRDVEIWHQCCWYLDTIT